MLDIILNMKGIILAGGAGSRLAPMTNVINKHLLPIYNKPMIFYPIETLRKCGIDQILIVVSGHHAGTFISVLKNGKEFGLKHIEYAYQEGNGGIADALGLAEDFAGNDSIAVILGDNTTDSDISEDVRNFRSGAHLFLKEVDDPQRFGVPEFNGDRIISITEKPQNPKSRMAVTGLYLYDQTVWPRIKNCKPSQRNELEITDVNNLYIKDDDYSFSSLNGFWKDAGNPDSLFEASQYWYRKNHG